MAGMASEEHRRKAREGLARGVARERERREFIDKLCTKAMSGEEVSADDLRPLAIADALKKLTNKDPAVRRQGQEDLDALCPADEKPRGGIDPMRPRN